MTKQSLPAVSLVNAENFETFSKSDKVVIVGFFEAADTTSNETFTAVANAQRDEFIFGATNDATLAKEQEVELPGVVLYKSFDEGKVVYKGDFESESLEKWTKEASIPLMGEIGPETYSGYMESGVPLLYLFVDNDDDKKSLTEELSPIAAKFRGRVNFATIDAKQFGGHASNLNLYDPFPKYILGCVNVNCVVRRLGPRWQFKTLRRTKNSLTINLPKLRPRALRSS